VNSRGRPGSSASSNSDCAGALLASSGPGLSPSSSMGSLSSEKSTLNPYAKVCLEIIKNIYLDYFLNMPLANTFGCLFLFFISVIRNLNLIPMPRVSPLLKCLLGPLPQCQMAPSIFNLMFLIYHICMACLWEL
jgi:hypothetical protein